MDALRALAIICVIAIHAYACSRNFVISELVGNLPSLNWIIIQFSGNTFRIGVDLFLMLSGALSLGRDWKMKDFFAHRFPRIVYPFLFWSILLGTIFLLLSYYDSFNVISSFDLVSIANYFYGVFMGIIDFAKPYWYFWMILGIYLIMPVFNKWILHSDLDDLLYFLFFWLITCLFDYTLGVEFPIRLSYFTSPIGLVVLGYYLRYTRRIILNNQYFALFLIIFSSLLMLVLSAIYSTDTHFYNFNIYSILVSMEVIGVFLLFKNFYKFNLNIGFFSRPDGFFNKSVYALARYSYGIFLIHNAFICVLVHYLGNTGIPPVLYMIILFVVSLLCSVIVMAVLSRIPYLNRVIGVK
ncbi:acyltransferase [Methanobrevibacter ruminantium M1]|uniref:Acyltransferase n=1 Tax=Methanobrevibacter ruminantium (strain ATCC 35063 / DSM 1093 / JCM 13430 / OCM 146 / M1) TaxID=634498 RepID=D3DZE5_METRM|nr:acyltransferase family protein [Methanobrevibacter ruminantium]ADC46100.1 acyltransferase [Methanobrevibacter ruminantium M1]